MALGDKLTPEELAVFDRAKPGRANKYRAVRTEYNGRKWPSKAHAEHAANLDSLVLAGEVAWYLIEVPISLGVPENRYVVDFLVGIRYMVNTYYIHAEEVKGVETAKFRRDKRLWKSYGPFPLKVFYRDHVEIIGPERRRT
jgi:hypothetical protein